MFKNLTFINSDLISNFKLKIKNCRYWLFASRKRLVISGSLLIILAALIFGIKYYRYNQQNPYGVWETLVVLRSQNSGLSPAEDAKTSLKRGDVIAVQPEHHAWSETEYKSYLLVKIEGRKDDVEKLLEPLTENSNQKNNGTMDQNIIRARKYAVDMDKVGFSGDQVVSGQPVENRIFKIDVIKEK